MKCENCKLNPSCTRVWKTSKKECPHFIQKTNADRIRSMNDEELARFLMDVSMGLLIDKRIMNVKAWLKQPAEEEQHG